MRKVRIAVDVMGGDYAPEEIVRGAVQGAKELGLEITLVGTKAAMDSELAKNDIAGLTIHQVEATEVIKDGEEPAFAVMRKRNNSMSVATKLVKNGTVDGMVSAGSTGALMVAALQYVGTLPGIERPMMGGPFLQLSPKTIVLDLGANVGCQPYHLVDFAVAGSVYARTFLGIENSTVGLLSVGSEPGKGNEQTKEAYTLLQNSGLNFIGNVEGHDIASGKADVIVCDGFVGNVLVKFSESLGQAVSKWLRTELSGKVDKTEIEKVAGKLYGLLSPGIALGGGVMWGVDGVVAKTHGSSRARQVVGTMKQAKIAIESGFVEQLKSELKKAQERIRKPQ